jgi:hypothetical protein
MTDEVKAQHAQMVQAQMAQQDQSGQGGAVPGTTPNATPFTQTDAPSTGSIGRTIGK